MKKNKKHLKELKRKKKLLQKRNNDALRHQISSGELTMYHFTSRNGIEGIKKYGLCIGDVCTNRNGSGMNAVNLTQQAHYHDPSHNGYEFAELRITVKLNTADCVNQKAFAKEHNTLSIHNINEGNVTKHWYYFGQIKTEDFVDVCLWNGKEYVSVELNDIETECESYLSNLRIWGNLHYDKSGVALQASDFIISSDLHKTIVSLTDAVNENFVGRDVHNEWVKNLLKFNQMDNFYGRLFSYAIQILLTHGIEIPATYLNSDIEKKHQIVFQLEERMGLSLKRCA